MTLPYLLPALPEIILAVGALTLLMIGVFVGDRSTALVTGLSIALLVVVGAVLLIGPVEGTTFSGAFVLDPFARFMKVLALIGSAVAIVMSIGYARAQHSSASSIPC